MSNLEYYRSLVRGKVVTIDTNVFLLLIIGSIGPDYINKFKCTSMFQKSDYQLLEELLGESYILLTPSVLAESSNFIDRDISATTRLKTIINGYKEHYRPSKELVDSECFLKLGFTDSTLFELSKEGVTIVTMDLPLTGWLNNNSFPVINFNHLRFPIL